MDGTVVDLYVELLNEPEAARREALALRVLTEDAEVFAAHLADSPPLDRAAFVEDCGIVQGWRPDGARLRRVGGVDGHHDWLRFAWEVSLPGGEVIEVGGTRIEGIDVVEVAEDGRFRRVIMFQAMLPPEAGATPRES
jgi:hypothetical protein